MHKAYLVYVSALGGLSVVICLLMAKTSASRVANDEAQQLRQFVAQIMEQPREHRDLIARIGAPLTPFLVDQLQTSPGRQNSPFRKLLTRLQRGLPDSIQEPLPEPMSEELRCLNAIRALAYLGTNAAGAVQALIPYLRDARFAPDAAHALASIGASAREAVPQLAVVLDDEVPWAATALGNIGQAAVEAIPALECAKSNALAEGPGWFRREVEKALEKIRADTPQPIKQPQSP